MTTVLPSCVTDAQDRRGEVGRVRRTPRREAVVDACEPGVFAHHPEQHADCDRAGDDDSGRHRQQQTRRELRVDTRAHERAQLRMGFDFVADDRARGARRRGICGGPAPDGRGDQRRPRPGRRPAEPGQPRTKGLPIVQSVKPELMQTPSTAAGAVGVASRPTRVDPASETATREPRDRFDPPPGGAAERLAGHARASPSGHRRPRS